MLTSSGSRPRVLRAGRGCALLRGAHFRLTRLFSLTVPVGLGRQSLGRERSPEQKTRVWLEDVERQKAVGDEGIRARGGVAPAGDVGASGESSMVSGVTRAGGRWGRGGGTRDCSTPRSLKLAIRGPMLSEGGIFSSLLGANTNMAPDESPPIAFLLGAGAALAGVGSGAFSNTFFMDRGLNERNGRWWAGDRLGATARRGGGWLGHFFPQVFQRNRTHQNPRCNPTSTTPIRRVLTLQVQFAAPTNTTPTHPTFLLS